jgi:hypothetical protein
MFPGDGWGGGLVKTLCFGRERFYKGKGKRLPTLVGGFLALLEVSRPCAGKPNSPRDEGFRSVVDLITSLPTPWRSNVCIVEGWKGLWQSLLDSSPSRSLPPDL